VSRKPVPDGLAVRRRLPPVAARHLARMPAGLQAQHDLWRVRQVSMDELSRGQLLAIFLGHLAHSPEVVLRLQSRPACGRE